MSQPTQGDPATPNSQTFIRSVPPLLWIVATNLFSIFISVGLSFILFKQSSHNSQNLDVHQISKVIQKSNQEIKEDNAIYIKEQITAFSTQLYKDINSQNQETNKHLNYIFSKIKELEKKTIDLTNKNQVYEIPYGFLAIPKAVEERDNEKGVSVEIKVINISNINYDNVLLKLKLGQQDVVLKTVDSGSFQFNSPPGSDETLEGTISNVSIKDKELEAAQILFQVPPSPLTR